MKHFSLIIGFIVIFIFHGSHVKSQESVYSWPLPESWVKEIIPFPLKFAPELKYPGVEEIHFMPGWRGDTLQDQQWSYIFVWKLDSIFIPDTSQLKHDLIVYFNGLTRWVIQNSRSRLKFQPVSFISVYASSGTDNSDFTGRITFLDVFFTFRPVTLNFIIISGTQQGERTSTMFFLLSPKPFDHEIWNILQNHVSEFNLIPKN